MANSGTRPVKDFDTPLEDHLAEIDPEKNDCNDSDIPPTKMLSFSYRHLSKV